jgi:hypothetical protein
MRFRLRNPLVDNAQQQQNNEGLIDAVNMLGQFLNTGAGSPNGAVTASPPALYLNRSGGAGTTLYVKESGVNTNTGWVAK